MLFNKTLVSIMMFAGTASSCMHHKGERRTSSLSEETKMGILKAQQTCDLDAFLCQSELDFTFPRDIFTSLPSKQDQGQREERQVLPTVSFLGSSNTGSNNKKSTVSSPSVSSEHGYYDPIGDMLNDMINFSMEMTSPVIMFSSSSPSSSSMFARDFDAMDKVMDDMLNSFFSSSSSSSYASNPTIIIETINNHGRRLLQENNDPARERLARRLTSVQYPAHSNNNYHQHAHHQPISIFSKNVDKCLWKRLQDNTLVSSKCGQALSATSKAASAQQEYYMLDPASLVVVAITFFIFTITTLLLFKILLTSNGASTSSARTENETTFMGEFCESLPLIALSIMLVYLSIANPTFVIMAGTPVMLALACYSCFMGEEETEEDDTIDHDLSQTVDGCVPLLVRRDDLNGDEVYVAIPAVI